jgi:hypothetical protein
MNITLVTKCYKAWKMLKGMIDDWDEPLNVELNKGQESAIKGVGCRK